MKQTILNGESGLSVRTKLNAMFTELYDFCIYLINRVQPWSIFFPESEIAVKLYTEIDITLTLVEGDVDTWLYSFDGELYAAPDSYTAPNVNINTGVFYIKPTFTTETAIMQISAIKR